MNSNVEPLAQAWIEAKRDETLATARRVEIEDKLIPALEIPDEGSKTQKVGAFKITVTQPIGRKLIADEWAKVAKLCPVDMQPVKIKVEADPAGMKWLQQNEPLMWAKIAPAFETKPGKVGFRIKAEVI